jgi:hypothetical protein
VCDLVGVVAIEKHWKASNLTRGKVVRPTKVGDYLQQWNGSRDSIEYDNIRTKVCDCCGDGERNHSQDRAECSQLSKDLSREPIAIHLNGPTQSP